MANPILDTCYLAYSNFIFKMLHYGYGKILQMNLLHKIGYRQKKMD